jgi:hypothetical protein
MAANYSKKFSFTWGLYNVCPHCLFIGNIKIFELNMETKEIFKNMKGTKIPQISETPYTN